MFALGSGEAPEFPQESQAEIDIFPQENLPVPAEVSQAAAGRLATTAIEDVRAAIHADRDVGRFVAAIRMTPSFDSKPSISTSS